MDFALILPTQGSIKEEQPFGLLEPFGRARYSVFKGVHLDPKVRWHSGRNPPLHLTNIKGKNYANLQN
ncbi:MAG: hypothetical protein J6Y85_04120 [Alphaproteobacteria bacterium]|nr:hypothetical protein [Alphaproteobacteria bacterium]